MLLPVAKSRINYSKTWVRLNLGVFVIGQKGPSFSTRWGKFVSLGTSELTTRDLNCEPSQKKSYSLQCGPSDYVIKDI